MSEKHAMSGLMELVDWLGKFQPRCDDWEQVPIEIDGQTFDDILCGFACEIDDISLAFTRLEEEVERLTDGRTVTLSPEEDAELVAIAGAAGYTPEDYLALRVRTMLPGTVDRLLARCP